MVARSEHRRVVCSTGTVGIPDVPKGPTVLMRSGVLGQGNQQMRTWSFNVALRPPRPH
jgi:hypothetical protein